MRPRSMLTCCGGCMGTHWIGRRWTGWIRRFTMRSVWCRSFIGECMRMLWRQAHRRARQIDVIFLSNRAELAYNRWRYVAALMDRARFVCQCYEFLGLGVVIARSCFEH